MYCYRTLQIHTAMPFHCNSTCNSLILLADVHKSLLLYHYFLIAFLYWKCTDKGITTSSFMSSCTFTFICANRNSVFQSRISNRVFHKQTWLQTVFFIIFIKLRLKFPKIILEVYFTKHGLPICTPILAELIPIQTFTHFGIIIPFGKRVKRVSSVVHRSRKVDSSTGYNLSQESKHRNTSMLCLIST